MSNIVRPNKPVGGGGTSEWTAGSDLYANELNDDINTIYADYNGNITNDNISAAAAINGSKLADAPNGIPTAKYNALSITNDKIANTTINKSKLAYLLGKDALAISINEVVSGAIIIAGGGAIVVIDPSIPFPTADYELISVHTHSVVANALVTVDAHINGLNWSSALRSESPNATWQGTVRFVFLKKVSA